MGHERVGFLPKTKKWTNLVSYMSSEYSSDKTIALVSTQTLKNVRKQYENLSRDDVIKKIFSFLVIFSRACRFENPSEELLLRDIQFPENPTLLSIIKILKEQIPSKTLFTEYGQIALAAAADAIGQWYKQNTSSQLILFKQSNEFYENWRKLGTGSGFCELARLFFGRLTERYLSYFLDRAASATFSNIYQRERFQQDLKTHIDDISKHAFETAMITQSFAAGWFNAHTQEKFPDDREIVGFLSVAFGKLRDELRREDESK